MGVVEMGTDVLKAVRVRRHPSWLERGNVIS